MYAIYFGLFRHTGGSVANAGEWGLIPAEIYASGIKKSIHPQIAQMLRKFPYTYLYTV